MVIKKGDFVKVTNKNDIEGQVVGFYKHTDGAVIRTSTGNEWIVDPAHLKRVRKKQ